MKCKFPLRENYQPTLPTPANISMSPSQVGALGLWCIVFTGKGDGPVNMHEERAPSCIPDAQRRQVGLPAENCKHVPAACTVGAVCSCQVDPTSQMKEQFPNAISVILLFICFTHNGLNSLQLGDSRTRPPRINPADWAVQSSLTAKKEKPSQSSNAAFRNSIPAQHP